MRELKNTYKENGLTLRLITDNYANNNAVYFGLIDDETKEPYCDITVNLNFSSNSIIELDNDFRNFSSKKLIKKIINDLTCDYLSEDYSGFCSYPIYFLKSEYIYL